MQAIKAVPDQLYPKQIIPVGSVRFAWPIKRSDGLLPDFLAPRNVRKKISRGERKAILLVGKRQPG